MDQPFLSYENARFARACARSHTFARATTPFMYKRHPRLHRVKISAQTDQPLSSYCMHKNAQNHVCAHFARARVRAQARADPMLYRILLSTTQTTHTKNFRPQLCSIPEILSVKIAISAEKTNVRKLFKYRRKKSPKGEIF